MNTPRMRGRVLYGAPKGQALNVPALGAKLSGQRTPHSFPPGKTLCAEGATAIGGHLSGTDDRGVAMGIAKCCCL